MDAYFIELQKLKNMDDETIFELYKCRKPCTFMEYKVNNLCTNENQNVLEF